MASVRPMSLVGCVNSVCIILGLVGNTCCWSGRRRSLNHAKKEKHFPNGWKAAAEAGQIYGWESFKRRGLYSPGTRPVICRNVVDYNRVNLTTGSKYYYNFVICPPPDTNETFNACCGRDDDHMKCCNVDLSYVLATVIIMAMVLTCLLCCCCGLVIYIFTARGPKHGAVLQPGHWLLRDTIAILLRYSITIEKISTIVTHNRMAARHARTHARSHAQCMAPSTRPHTAPTLSQATISQATRSQATLSQATRSQATRSQATISQAILSQPTLGQTTRSQATSRPATRSPANRALTGSLAGRPIVDLHFAARLPAAQQFKGLRRDSARLRLLGAWLPSCHAFLCTGMQWYNIQCTCRHLLEMEAKKPG